MTRKIICFYIAREVRKENGKVVDGGLTSFPSTNLLFLNWFKMEFCLDGAIKIGEEIPSM